MNTESKQGNNPSEDISRAIGEIGAYVETVMGIVREFPPYRAAISDDLDVTILSDSGWGITLPKMSPVWILVIDWLNKWDDESKGLMEMYIKVLAHPTSIRISDIDEQYVNDILKAHSDLTERNIAKGLHEHNDIDV